MQKKNPSANIVWIVYRPAYISRGREDGQNYIANIREQAAKRQARNEGKDGGKGTAFRPKKP